MQRNEDCAAQCGLCSEQSAILQRNDPKSVHATNFFRPFPGGQSKYFWCTSQISNKQIILFFNSRQNTLSTGGPNQKTIIVFYFFLEYLSAYIFEALRCILAPMQKDKMQSAKDRFCSVTRNIKSEYVTSSVAKNISFGAIFNFSTCLKMCATDL